MLPSPKSYKVAEF